MRIVRPLPDARVRGVSTRMLLVLSLFCGIAILAAFAVQLFIAR